MTETRDHGGGLDAAVTRYGGTRDDWVDLSTGINPVPYPVGEVSDTAWTALPDVGAQDRLIAAARAFWNVPDGAEVIAAPGASALIARMPEVAGNVAAYIPTPTYNEHAAAFRAHNSLGAENTPESSVHVYVHPNNPTGTLWPREAIGGRNLTIVDESFCDVMPGASHINHVSDADTIILKSFGKFWGLAGLRLGFAIAAPQVLAPTGKHVLQYKPEDFMGYPSLKDLLGPWAVSGPALEIGARALEDVAWADATRARLADDAARLDRLMVKAGVSIVGGTDLFRLYDVDDAKAWQDRLAQHHVWSRIFPYSDSWLRLGLPAPDQWDQLEAAL